jgi:hypothetical protein
VIDISIAANTAKTFDPFDPKTVEASTKIPLLAALAIRHRL